MSEPEASSVVPAASDAAEPPEEPPGVYAVFHGLRVTPHIRVWVKKEQLNSGVVVRAWMIPPAARMRSMTGAFSVATFPAFTTEPSVSDRPAIACFSLVATGMPSSGRGSRPPLPR